MAEARGVMRNREILALCDVRRKDLLRLKTPSDYGIGVDDAAWDHSVFSKNRDRLLEGDIAAKF